MGRQEDGQARKPLSGSASTGLSLDRIFHGLQQGVVARATGRSAVVAWRHVAALVRPVLHLARHLGEHLRRERVPRAPGEVAERHELHEVAAAHAAVAVAEGAVVAIQHAHEREVRLPDADDNDGQRRVRGVDDGIHGGVGVVDAAVGEDQQDGVLVRRRARGARGLLDHRREVRRPRQAHARQREQVRVENPLDVVHVRVLLSIQVEAVADAVQRAAGAVGDDGAEAEARHHFVAVVFHQDVGDGLRRAEVLVVGVASAAVAVVVQGRRVGRVAVAGGEVDCDGEVHLQPGAEQLREARDVVHGRAGDVQLPVRLPGLRRVHEGQRPRRDGRGRLVVAGSGHVAEHVGPGVGDESV
mmetsp:Transcript_15728/g.48759  ORF Transcript_15728/g.48759 Transcript_15728/m.48759 type:complete len:357 (-) Transcript_15728:978-2048(-)